MKDGSHDVNAWLLGGEVRREDDLYVEDAAVEIGHWTPEESEIPGEWITVA